MIHQRSKRLLPLMNPTFELSKHGRLAEAILELATTELFIHQGRKLEEIKRKENIQRPYKAQIQMDEDQL